MNPSSAQRLPIYHTASIALILTLISSCFLVAGSLQTHDIARASASATVGGCPLYPADNIWNRDISTLPVHRNSANYIASIGPTGHIHADFGAGLYGGGPIGIP